MEYRSFKVPSTWRIDTAVGHQINCSQLPDISVPSIESAVFWVDKPHDMLGVKTIDGAVGMSIDGIDIIELCSALPAKGPGWMLINIAYGCRYDWNCIIGNNRQWVESEFAVANEIIHWLGDTVGVRYACDRSGFDA